MAKISNPTSIENGKKKNKKKSKPGPNSVAMKLKSQKPNPFETLWSRRKFDILGKKRKGEERRMGLARSRSIEKRKKTLLEEYKQSSKASVFLDKRIGEQNEGLGEFDKAILRFQRERQLKLSKKSKYNLSDGEEDDLEIEGVGSFEERDDFEDEVSFDDDDDARYVAEADKRATILKQLGAHNSPNELERNLLKGEESRPKSKKEVMEEIISKNKFFKAEKAKEKEENEQFVEELDKIFASLVDSKALLSPMQPNKMNALRPHVDKSIPTNSARQNESSTVMHKKIFEKEKADSYDKLVNEMVLDMRAHPSDRTKTPEEIAQDEKERLEQLEEERQKRMLATDYSSDEDGEVTKDDVSIKRQRSISGDDLGDSFSHDEESKNKLRWIDLILRRDNKDVDGEDAESSGNSESSAEEEETTDEADDEGEKSLSLKDWEQSDDDKLDTDVEKEGSRSEDKDEEEEGEKGEEDVGLDEVGEPSVDKRCQDIKERKSYSLDAVKMSRVTQQNDLPFTIEAPKTLEEFTLLLENRSPDEIVEAIKRIRSFNAITIATENRKKIQVFYGVLLQSFAVSSNKRPSNFKLLNILVKPLIEMSMEIPYFAAICARERLLRTRTQLCEDIKSPGISCWPSLKTLFLFRLWSMIFPCSDFRHVVMTPAILLMCEYLMHSRIMCGRDIVIGSFLCSMVLSITKQSKKFCPEAIIFLRTMLMAAMDRKQGYSKDSQLYNLMELKTHGPLLCIAGNVNEINYLDFLTVLDLPEDDSFFCSDNFRASMLMVVTETLQGFVNIYEEFKSFPELFLPISRLLLELAKQALMPVLLQDKFRDVAAAIENKIRELHILRQPLQMRKQKPVPIKLLNPKFEENFVKGRDYDPDRERAERRKLKKLLKQEAKGAARELRKDNYFLFEVKEKDKALLQEEKAEKYGKDLAFLQEQENAFKSGQLGKGVKRRR